MIYSSRRAYILLYKKNDYEKSTCHHFVNVDMDVLKLLETFGREYRSKNPPRKVKQSRKSDIQTRMSLTRKRKSNR